MVFFQFTVTENFLPPWLWVMEPPPLQLMSPRLGDLAGGGCAHRLGSPSGQRAARCPEAGSAAPALVGKHPASHCAPEQAGFSSEERGQTRYGACFSSLGSQVPFEGEYTPKATPQ